MPPVYREVLRMQKTKKKTRKLSPTLLELATKVINLVVAIITLLLVIIKAQT